MIEASFARTRRFAAAGLPERAPGSRLVGRPRRPGSPGWSAPRSLLASLVVILFAGCAALRPPTPPSSFYMLDRVASPTQPLRSAAAAATPSTPASTLLVNPPHAATGFDSPRLIYVREAHKLEYFAYSEWADTPARMIAPLIVDALERSAAFSAVVRTPSSAAGDLKLDTEILRLQHEFGSRPSRVRFTLRAYLLDNTTRQVLAWREFDATVAAASDDPYGGVVAANRAVQAVLMQLADFCGEAAGKRPTAARP